MTEEIKQNETPENNNTEVKMPAGPSLTRLISDVGPALVFFISYMIAQKIKHPQPLILATIIFLPAAIIGFIYSWVKEKKISPVGAFTFVVVGIFSLLGIFLKNDLFIKMRPTALFSAIGIILLLSVAFKRNILKTVFDGMIHMPEEIWRTLAIRVGVWNIILALLNELFWRNFPENIWVTYHTWGDMILNSIFWFINIILLSKHFTDENGNPLLENEK